MSRGGTDHSKTSLAGLHRLRYSATLAIRLPGGKGGNRNRCTSPASSPAPMGSRTSRTWTSSCTKPRMRHRRRPSSSRRHRQRPRPSGRRSRRDGQAIGIRRRACSGGSSSSVRWRSRPPTVRRDASSRAASSALRTLRAEPHDAGGRRSRRRRRLRSHPGLTCHSESVAEESRRGGTAIRVRVVNASVLILRLDGSG